MLSSDFEGMTGHYWPVAVVGWQAMNWSGSLLFGMCESCCSPASSGELRGLRHLLEPRGVSPGKEQPCQDHHHCMSDSGNWRGSFTRAFWLVWAEGGRLGMCVWEGQAKPTIYL